MYQSESGPVEPLADYRLEGTTVNYSQFLPRLYALCRELGMERGRIMPSRAFCADESQGYPLILIAKHSGVIESNEVTGSPFLERNLIRYMPQIVTSPAPALTAAKINTQLEFDRTYRTLVQEPAFQRKRLLFVAGLNVDVSPSAGSIFPLTKFIPWAAYWQSPDGQCETWEQADALDRLQAQASDNPDQLDLEAATQALDVAP